MITIDEAKRLSLKQLASVGLFNLRALMDKVGLVQTEESRVAFHALDNDQRATAIYKELNKARLPDWYEEEWVKDLFERVPELCSLSERSCHGLGRDPYKYVMCVRSSSCVYEYMVLNSREFNSTFILNTIKDLLASGGVKNSRWLDDLPSGVTYILNRHDYLLKETAPFRKEVEQEEYEDAVRAHGRWMLAAFDAYPTILRFVKAPNKVASPSTFAIVASNHHTWMKEPTFSKILARMRLPLHLLRKVDGSRVWEEGEPIGHLVFTREELEKCMYELELIRKDDVGSHQEAPVVPVEQTHCVCGSELRSNKTYVVAAQPDQPTKCCGECAAKADPKYNERTALTASRKVHLEPPAKVRAAKFDPRPGIDDRGAWSSPSWEEDYS